MTTSPTLTGETTSEATPALKDDLGRSGMGSGLGKPGGSGSDLAPGALIGRFEIGNGLFLWSQRPSLLHLGLFFSAYVLGCGFAHALAIVPGITVSIWPPAGVFIATLILTSPPSWPWWILAGCLAEMFAQLVWFHSPLPAGFLIYVGNALCAAVGATLIRSVCRRPVRLETLREVLAFVVLGAGVAPLASATWGSATLAWFEVKSQTFASVWPLFWIGDATGILLVAPLVLVAIQYRRGDAQILTVQWTEAGALGLIFLGVAALSLSGYLPSAYLVLPPLLWAAVRFELRGAAVALGPPSADHRDIHDIRHQPIRRRPRDPAAKAGHAAALSGHLVIFRAYRRRNIPPAPAGTADVAAERAAASADDRRRAGPHLER